MTAWRRFLADPALHRLAGRERLELVFLAHPHLQHHITAAMLPTRVRLVTAADADVQQILATARLLVTDYSSLAFDVAYLGAPVVYFQFDAPDFFSGNHTVAPGTSPTSVMASVRLSPTSRRRWRLSRARCPTGRRVSRSIGGALIVPSRSGTGGVPSACTRPSGSVNKWRYRQLL